MAHHTLIIDAWTVLRRSLTGLLLVACVGPVTADEQAYMGEARDDDGRLVYTEHHRVTTTRGMITGSVTEYKAPDGVLIAMMQSDYSRNVAMPTYVFEDYRRGHREGLRWQDGAYFIFRQEANKQEKRSRLQEESDVFSCQGWHYHLTKNLNQLERDMITMNLVLPSQLRPIPFVVKKITSAESLLLAELSTRHWLYRHFAPSMRLEYDKLSGRLLSYHGVSNILNKSGERQEVTIRYIYPAE